MACRLPFLSTFSSHILQLGHASWQVKRFRLADVNGWSGVVSRELQGLFSSDYVRGEAFTELQRQSAKAVVYVPFRRLAEEVAGALEAMAGIEGAALHGVHFGYVHAGLEEEQRREAMALWRKEGVQAVLVATECCAAGLDVPTVRGSFVCGVRNTLINVFQSFGRAGRDGQPAIACLLVDEPSSAGIQSASADEKEDIPLHSSTYHYNDWYEGPALEQGQRLLLKYADGQTCRRQSLHTMIDGEGETCITMAQEGFLMCDMCDEALNRVLQRAPPPHSHAAPQPSRPAAQPAAGTIHLSHFMLL